MASTAQIEALASELTRFQIYPRETIRAAESILRESTQCFWDIQELAQADVATLQREAMTLLEDRGNSWPLTLKNGSPLSKLTRGIVASATIVLKYYPKKEPLRRYFAKLPEFYHDKVEVDDDGRLLRQDVVSFVPPAGMSEKWIDTNGKKKKKGVQARPPFFKLQDRCYIDEDGAAREEFDHLFEAAVFKSLIYPQAERRTKSWRIQRNAMLASPDPLLVAAVVNMDFDRVPKVLEEVDMEIRKDDTDNNQSVIKETRQFAINNREVCGDQPTPTGTRVSSPTPSKHPIDNDGQNANTKELELTYTATLRTATETVTININPVRIEGPESKVLEATKELWDWMTNKGVDDKVTLEEVVELARGMVAKKEENAAVVN